MKHPPQQIPGKLIKRLLFFGALAYYARQNRDGQLRRRSKVISIFSAPRGGSTWLAETLQQLPRSVALLEPLHKDAYREIRQLDLGWDPYIPEQAQWPEAEALFSRLFDGRLTPWRNYITSPWRHLLRPDFVVIKFVRGNLCLPWLVNRFSDIHPVVLLRHPCAVVASQLRHPLWSWAHGMQQFQYPAGRYSDEFYAQFADITRSLRHPDEILAARWAIFTAHVLKHREHNRKWHTMAYERIYSEPAEELARLARFLELDTPPTLNTGTISASTIAGSSDRIQSGAQLSHWRQTLEPAQIRRIMNVVRELGVECYSADQVEPDYGQLYATGPGA